MSITGTIHIFPTSDVSKIVTPRQWIDYCVAMSPPDPKYDCDIFYTEAVENGWADFLYLLETKNDRDSAPWYTKEPACRYIDYDFIDKFDFKNSMTISFSCEYSTMLWKATTEDIPSEINGNYGVAGAHINIGEHDIFDGYWNKFIARPFVSYSFWGQGSPNDSERLVEEIAKLPMIIKIREHFEKLIGPTEIFGEWG